MRRPGQSQIFDVFNWSPARLIPEAERTSSVPWPLNSVMLSVPAPIT